MDLKKLEALLENEAFAEKLQGMDSIEEVVAALKEKGVEGTVEELKELLEQVIKLPGAGELDLDALDSVAGGRIMIPMIPSVSPSAMKLAKKLAEMIFGKKKK